MGLVPDGDTTALSSDGLVCGDFLDLESFRVSGRGGCSVVIQHILRLSSPKIHWHVRYVVGVYTRFSSSHGYGRRVGGTLKAGGKLLEDKLVPNVAFVRVFLGGLVLFWT